jgi:hypothetical protein
MYFVFFWSSSDPDPDPTGLVIAATTADAEFEFVCDCEGVDASTDAVRLDLLIVTVVQSWQSGACRSGVLYLFFVDIGWYSLFVNQCLYSLFIFISNNLFE